MRSIEWKAALLGVAMFVGCAVQPQAQDVGTIVFFPDTAGGYPEGIAWNAHAGAFMVSSLRGGQLGLVSPKGEYKRFTSDPALITSSGIVVDTARNRVLVCNEDPGVAQRSTPATRIRLAQVREYALDSGRLQRVYDFSHLSKGPIMSNDLAIDAQGNIYVTDSFQPQIYKVDQATKAVSIFVRSERLMPVVPAEAVGTQPYLNGIVYHPGGFLIAADYYRGLLWKVPLDAPDALSEINLPQRLKGPDGLLLRSPTELVAVQSFLGADQGMEGDVTLIASSDGWTSARIEAVAIPSEIDGPTTATLKYGEVWVVNSRFPRMFADPANADRTREFSIVRVDFERDSPRGSVSRASGAGPR